MSERERWIVYPLLFFALGASLRDKLTQQIRTDHLHAGQISCEELIVTDAEKPDRVVAKLTSNAPQSGDSKADRYGVFVLIDSEGKELCGVTNNQLQINRIACQNLAVIDPADQSRALAVLTSATAATPGKPPRYVGSLLLTDSEGRQFFGLAEDQLKMRHVICEGIAVIDPEHPEQPPLAGLGSAKLSSSDAQGEGRRVGVLALNKQQIISLSGPGVQAPFAPQAPPPSAAKSK